MGAEHNVSREVAYLGADSAAEALGDGHSYDDDKERDGYRSDSHLCFEFQP